MENMRAIKGMKQTRSWFLKKQKGIANTEQN